jgi:hypothetical protein
VELVLIENESSIELDFFEKTERRGYVLQGSDSKKRAKFIKNELEKRRFVTRELDANKVGLNDFLGKSFQYSKEGSVVREIPDHLYDVIVASSQLKKSVLFIHVGVDCKPEVAHYVGRLLETAMLGYFEIPMNCSVVIVDVDSLVENKG